MATQDSFNMNTSRRAMGRLRCELPGISCKQTSTWNGKMFEIPPLFALCHMRRAGYFLLLHSVLTLPKTSPFIWSLKIHKMWLGNYFYARIAFDLLQLNHQKAVQETEPLHPLLFRHNWVLNFRRWPILIWQLIAGVAALRWGIGGRGPDPAPSA